MASALAEARGVRGVATGLQKSVGMSQTPRAPAHRIPMSPPPLPSGLDARILRTIFDKLRRSPFARGHAVQVESEGGVVHLRGWVRSAEEQRHVVGVASLVLGVRAVHDHLQLRPV